MTVLITTTLGASHRYRDQEMMRRTFGAFLNSIKRQTDSAWRLFVVCHNRPTGDLVQEFLPDDRIHFCSIDGGDPLGETTRYPKKIPEKVTDPIEWEILPYGDSMGDMSRKTWVGMIEAGHWAWENHLPYFWLLRMDSDDLLARDHVETIHRLQKEGVEAVYNRICHMYDPRHNDLAIHRYPYSTTVNAIFTGFDGDTLPRWFYHCTDHTTFYGSVNREMIHAREVDYALCIITNSGNSLSDRPEIDKEKNVERIAVDPLIVERYGIDYFWRPV